MLPHTEGRDYEQDEARSLLAYRFAGEKLTCTKSLLLMTGRGKSKPARLRLRKKLQENLAAIPPAGALLGESSLRLLKAVLSLDCTAMVLVWTIANAALST